MSKVFIEETTLSAIGAAIREKTGKSDLIAPGDMPAEIENIPTGGGEIEIEPIVLTGNCNYGCSGPMATTYIQLFGDTVSTQSINMGQYMFYNYGLDRIPFDLNFRTTNQSSISYMFQYATKLKTLPKISFVKPDILNNMFDNCNVLREIPDDYFDNFDWSYIDNLSGAYSGNMSALFYSCYSLRKIPMEIWKHGNPNSSNIYSHYYNGFTSCFALDEIVNLPFPHYNATWTSNAFYYSFNSCERLKTLTFALQEDGTPYVMKWKSQIIDLSGSNNMNLVGFARIASTITGYNSGITADKEVKNDATYQALKNDPDWFSCNVNYSRYNHDSAVETINSLPDTSAYLASAGGTNTIKFRGQAGSLTDGGAISNLTEEEIAVATAKGWTVSLV